MIKAAFFDLDGTLYDRDALVAEVVGGQFDLFREELAHVGKDRFVARVLELDDHGYADKDHPVTGVYGRIAREWELSADLADRLRRHFWTDFYAQSALPDDTLTTLQALRQHGKKLGIISNGSTARQRKKIEVLGIEPLFDVILISENERLRKPDAAIFQRALELCSVKPSEAIFVGDHSEVDVAGARKAGLHAAWRFVPYWRLEASNVPVLRRLSEILPLCSASATSPE